MRTYHSYRSASLLVIALLAGLPDLAAQTFGDDDNLFIPPAITVTSNSSEDRPVIVVTRLEDPQWTPLLPALFFDNPGDWIIPERYQLFASPAGTRDYADTNGTEEKAYSYSLPKYYEILNILGNRLQRYPESVLALRGCYSFEGGESYEVARERALVVQEYLAGVWEIDTARIPLLPVARRADTLASNPLQAEARRVEFVTETPELLEPVTFPHIGIRGESTHLQIVLVPNMEPEKIDSIEVMILDDTEQVEASLMVPGSPDSTTYTMHAFWEQSKLRGEDGMTLVVRVHGVDGRIRPSNEIFLPVRIRTGEPVQKWLSPEHYFVPFLDFGAAGLGAHEKRTLASAIAFYESTIEPEEREGYALFAAGVVDVAEHPSLNAVEVNVRAVEAMPDLEIPTRPTPSGRLMVKKLVQFEQDGKMMGYYMHYISQEKRDEWDRTYEQNLKNHAHARTSRPELGDADSLELRRAENTVAWLVDSLGVPLINEEIPESAGWMVMPYGARAIEGEEQEIEIARSGLRMQQGVQSRGQGGERIYFLPEARWFGRGVWLEFWSRAYLESRLDR